MAFNVQHEKRKRKDLVLKDQKYNGLPPELTDVEELYNRPVDEIKFETFDLATDSGAHSLYKEHFVVGDKISAQARVNADYSYVKTKEFKKFLDSYIEQVHQYKHLYTFYVTLDIINNPEESWKITEYIESCGLEPMPVFHNGEDIHWLERMVEKYPYIGISGLGQDITKSKFKVFGDSCFKVICDKHGKPKCKVHGFAMGAPEIIKMYPWYSADQSTWTYMSRVGSLLVPKPLHKGKELLGYDFLSMYKVIPVTERRDVESVHIKHLPELMNHFVQEYLNQNDIHLEAIKDSYHWRDVANIRMFHNIEKAAKSYYQQQFDYAEGGNIYYAGTAAGAGLNKSRLIKLLHDVKIPTMRWLTTPVYDLHARNVRELVEARNEGIDWRTLWDAEIAGRARRSTVGVLKPNGAPKVERKEIKVKRPPIELDITMTFKVRKVIDSSYYGALSLEQIAKAELQNQLNNCRDGTVGITPDVELTVKCGDKTIRKTTQAESIVKTDKGKNTYGFF